MYILTTIVYWISTNNIEISEVSETGKNLITFLFVPINGLLILPIFAKSYYSYKMGTLNSNILKKRGIFLGVILLILLVIECIYFKNIQVQVVNLLKEQEANSTQEQQYFTNSTIILVESNEVNVENQIEVNTTNDVTNETRENVISNNIISNSTNETEGNVINEPINVTVNENAIE